MKKLVIALLPAFCGCAELRSEFMPATGEPMHIHDRTVTRTGVEQVEVGHTENSKGETTSTQYANQVVHWQEREYYALQGRERLDDESFYRIAGDREAVARYDSFHKGGVSKNVLGWILLPLGLGIAGGGTATWFVGNDMKDASGNLTQNGSTITTIGYVGLGIGAALAVLGGTLISLGRHEAAATDVRLIEDPGRMKADAARYNDAMLGTGTITQPRWQRLYAPPRPRAYPGY